VPTPRTRCTRSLTTLSAMYVNSRGESLPDRAMPSTGAEPTSNF
jgi:hypothetical protein